MVDIQNEITTSLGLEKGLLDAAFKTFEASLKDLSHVQKDLDQKVIMEIFERFSSTEDDTGL